MSWHRIVLTNDQVVAGEHMNIQDAFTALFTAALAPKEAALFSAGHAAEDYALYFSPGSFHFAKALILSKGGASCDAPPKDGTSLVVGHGGARDALLS